MSERSDLYDKVYYLWAKVAMDCNIGDRWQYEELSDKLARLFDAADEALTHLSYELSDVMDKTVKAAREDKEAWATDEERFA